MIARRLAALVASLREEDLDEAGALDQARRLSGGHEGGGEEAKARDLGTQIDVDLFVQPFNP